MLVVHSSRFCFIVLVSECVNVLMFTFMFALDLVKEEQARDQYEKIKSFVTGV